jgi:prophage DNA circulation protein
MTDLAAKYHRDGGPTQISFKGARIYWRQGENDSGRRTALHSYPLRDTSLSEDLGKKAGEFTLEGFTLGQGFIDDAAGFREACNSPGAGVLVHPLWGQLTVVCTECRERFTTSKKGMVEFFLTFIEEGENRYPSSEADYRTLTAGQAASSLLVFQTSFNEAVNYQGPGWLAQSQVGDTQIALQTLGSVIKVMLAATDQGQVLDAIDQANDDLVNNSDDPAAPGDAVDYVYQSLGTIYQRDPSGGLNTNLAMSGFGMDVSQYGQTLASIPSTTATRETQTQNRASLLSLVSGYSAAGAVSAAMEMEYTSKQHAQSVRESVINSLDESTLLAAELGDDQGYDALQSLSAQTSTAFKSIIAEQQPAVEMPVPAGVTPALGLAYQLYEDPTREEDILNRNPVVFHPGILPGGEILEVLSA